MLPRSNLLLLVFLSGCGLISDDWFEDQIQDLDGDGAISDRFGGPDCRDRDPNITACDLDNDGAASIAAGGDDCDDNNPDVFVGAAEICNGVDDDCDGDTDDEDGSLDSATQQRWYRDQDQDQYLDRLSEFLSCERPIQEGYFLEEEGLGDDCDDTVTTIHPGADENCEAQDLNCDGDFYKDAVLGALVFYIDEDDDGYGSPVFELYCEGLQPEHRSVYTGDCDDNDPNRSPGRVEDPTTDIDENCDFTDDDDADHDGFARPEDCDDANATVFPGALEVGCDGFDNDCNGLIDDLSAVSENLNNPSLFWFLDVDGDGFGDPNEPRLSCTNTNLDETEVYVRDNTDCDDEHSQTHLGAVEVYYNGVDENCVPSDDDDQDGDGFPLNEDCDDEQGSMFPGAVEICDGVDNDCDGAQDNLLQVHTSEQGLMFYRDDDGDGAGVTEDWRRACLPPEGFTNDPGDCDDANNNIAPGLDEHCDDIDHNCDGSPTFGAVEAVSLFIDQDGDQQGDPGLQITTCSTEGLATNGDDCDDSNSAIFSGAVELCDGVDSNCGGEADSDDPLLIMPEVFFEDLDDDGFYAEGAAEVAVASCDQLPEHIATVSGDCDDSNGNTYPGATELCDGEDNDCDGEADNNLNLSRFYPDLDGDGDGDRASAGQLACVPPTGWSASNTDCNDHNNQVFFGADELCNQADDDCDGLVDNHIAPGEGSLYYLDLDLDNFGDPYEQVRACQEPYLYVEASVLYDPDDPATFAFFDCDDSDPTLSPTKDVELCDGKDNNCDGVVDASYDLEVTYIVSGEAYGTDADGDGLAGTFVGVFCDPPEGLVLFEEGADCDDNNPNVSSNHQEICGNVVDEDCSGDINDGEHVLQGYPLYYDSDDDGFAGTYSGLNSCTETFPEDCDDNHKQSYPGAPERCTGTDSDCDGEIDEVFSGFPPFDPLIREGRELYLWDGDEDGAINPDAEGQLYCLGATTPTWVVSILDSPLDDCDDANPEVYPGAPESCDGVDKNCDGSTFIGVADVGAAANMYPTISEVLGAFDDCENYTFNIQEGYTLTETIYYNISVPTKIQSTGRFNWTPPVGMPAVDITNGEVSITGVDLQSSTAWVFTGTAGDLTVSDANIIGCAASMNFALNTQASTAGFINTTVHACNNGPSFVHSGSGLDQMVLNGVNVIDGSSALETSGFTVVNQSYFVDLQSGIQVTPTGSLAVNSLRMEGIVGAAIINDGWSEVSNLIANNTAGIQTTAQANTFRLFDSRITNVPNTSAGLRSATNLAEVINSSFQGGYAGIDLLAGAQSMVVSNSTFANTPVGVLSNSNRTVHLDHSLFFDVPNCISGIADPYVYPTYVYSDLCDFSVYSAATDTVLIAAQPTFNHYDPTGDPLFWDLRPSPTDTILLNQDPFELEFDGSPADVGLSVGGSYGYGSSGYNADVNGNSIDDGLEFFWYGSLIWTTYTDGTPYPEDFDGDGVLNTDEVLAYTDPFDATSY